MCLIQSIRIEEKVLSEEVNGKEKIMMTLKRTAVVTVVLGIVSLISVFVAHLALTDIYHGEGDLGLEWSVLRGCFAVIVVFQLFTLLTLRRIISSNRLG